MTDLSYLLRVHSVIELGPETINPPHVLLMERGQTLSSFERYVKANAYRSRLDAVGISLGSCSTKTGLLIAVVPHFYNR